MAAAGRPTWRTYTLDKDVRVNLAARPAGARAATGASTLRLALCNGRRPEETVALVLRAEVAVGVTSHECTRHGVHDDLAGSTARCTVRCFSLLPADAIVRLMAKEVKLSLLAPNLMMTKSGRRAETAVTVAGANVAEAAIARSVDHKISPACLCDILRRRCAPAPDSVVFRIRLRVRHRETPDRPWIPFPQRRPPPANAAAGNRRKQNMSSCVEDVVVSLQAAKNNSQLHDFELVCGDAVIPCSRFVLAARSEVFRAMLSHENTREVHEGRMVVEDAEPEELEVFMQLLYTGQSEGLARHARKIYMLADKYQIPSITKACLVSMEANLNPANAAAIAILAHVYSETGFETKVLTFIKDHLTAVRRTPEWKSIEKEHAAIVTKVLALKLREEERAK